MQFTLFGAILILELCIRGGTDTKQVNTYKTKPAKTKRIKK